MRIITTIYCSELRLQQSLLSEAAAVDPVEVMQLVEGDFERAGREWVSVYEGKNRVLPFDSEQ